jgi:hypothetical protein
MTFNKRLRFLRISFTASFLLVCTIFYNCEFDGDGEQPVIIVNSLIDSVAPPAGVTTLRQAIADVLPGGKVEFDRSLDGQTILLNIVGEEHSILKAETFIGMDFLGYTERDYGKSAIYARKNITIDANNLPNGITLEWDGGTVNPARVLAVYGNLRMNNVTLTGGFSKAEALLGDQPYTLARGGGLATWGKAVLNNCVIHGNRIEGDPEGSRDRGAKGGGLYGNLLILNDCVISGNQAIGYGATGGGVCSVGGEGMPDQESVFNRCTISGNRVTSQHSYGGGVFSEGGGRGGNNWLVLINCTIARNLVEDHPGIPDVFMYYYRGGGVYMTNGSLSVNSSTIVENVVTGNFAVIRGKPNMGGGGIAATIGDAHVVEHMEISHSIVAGNFVDGLADDVYTGSLLQFNSYGYNLFGKADFSQVLVPIPTWWSLGRKHWPKLGDSDEADVSAVLDLGNVEKHPFIMSVGTDDGDSAVLWYPPAGNAIDQIPDNSYNVRSLIGEYEVLDGQTDDFLYQVLEKLRNDFGMGPAFGQTLGGSTLGGDNLKDGTITWQGEDESWPSDPLNEDWIKFWRDLDVELGDSLGPQKLGDNFWSDFQSGPLGNNLNIFIKSTWEKITPPKVDQLENARPENGKIDIGSIEN